MTTRRILFVGSTHTADGRWTVWADTIELGGVPLDLAPNGCGPAWAGMGMSYLEACRDVTAKIEAADASAWGQLFVEP